MTDPSSLLRQFHAARAEASPADDAGLGELLARVVEQGCMAWPDLALDPAVLAAHLGELSRTAADLRPWLASVPAADLALACACAHQVPGAAQRLVQEHQHAVEEALARSIRQESARADLRQKVLEKVAVGTGGEPARIASYQGRGPLHAWLRVVATREALSALRATEREIPGGDDLLFERATVEPDPELAALKRLHRTAFRDAFVQAMGDLPAQDRLLLRQHYQQGMTIDDLAPHYQVHRATAARWLQRVRVQVFNATREALAQRLNVNTDEFASLARLLLSQLNVSMDHLLVSGGKEPS